MSAEPTGPTGSPIWWKFGPRQIKMVVLTSAVLVIAGIAFFIWRGVEEEASDEVWDEYFALRKEYEPEQDPLWTDPFGVYAAQRQRYINALERFLDARATKEGGVLEPQVRWRIARTLADHVLALKDVLDPEKRLPHYERAIAHLQAIKDQHPDFPLNWAMFSTPEFPSLTRQFLAWFESNRAWEAEYLPRDAEPDGTETVVVRTTLGDMRMRLYSKDAPQWTKGFVQRATDGIYDGTALVERREAGDSLAPRESTVRGGSEASRGVDAYQWTSLEHVVDTPTGGGALGEESRNRIPFTRGIVAAWHDPATVYDHEQALLFSVGRSPQLDYDYTPIGKLIDEPSLATLDRIFEGSTWRDDPKVRDDTGARGILDAFQVPTRIVKVLVFDASGALVASSGEPSGTKAAVEASERRLDSLVVDAYLAETPARPGANDGDGDGDGADDGGDKGD